MSLVLRFMMAVTRVCEVRARRARVVLLARHACGVAWLVLAAGVQRCEDEEVGKSKQPVVGLLPCGGNRARDEANVPGARQSVEMLEADAGQVGGLRVREDLLTGLDLDHGLAFSRPCQEETRAGRWRGLQRGPPVVHLRLFSSWLAL